MGCSLGDKGSECYQTCEIVVGGESKENNNNKRDPMENLIVDHEKLMGEDNMMNIMKKNRGWTGGCVPPIGKW